MGVRQQAPIPVFPPPGVEYQQKEESQYRQTVQRAIQEVVGHLTDARTGTPALVGNDNNNFKIGVSDFIRVTAAFGGGSAITGIAGGYSGRRVVIVNLENTLTIEHQDTASTAENRIITATAAAITLVTNDMAELIYDEITARWRVMGTAV